VSNFVKTASSRLIAQRLLDLLVGRAVRSPKFRFSSYDKVNINSFDSLKFPLSRQKKLSKFVRRRMGACAFGYPPNI